ncbi:MAG: D-glycero-alpha-D-manno-heptose 1-phosphate guanylyltransferase [Bacteriovoracaceae bacterium]|jgi:D-glycero-alpha-D-manno-heptose 1-phosphate guanylyltransferase
MNLDNIEVIILAGGLGQRIKPVYPDLPKCLIPINEAPFLSYLLSHLKKVKLSNICIATGVMSEQISHYTSKLEKEFPNLRISHEEDPLGTGGALKKAIKSSSFEKFLVLNGDTYFNIDLEKFMSLSTAPFTMALSLMKNIERFSSVEVDSENKVINFNLNSEKDTVLQNAGTYSCTLDIINYIGDSKTSLEMDVFPKLIESKLISAQVFQTPFFDIGTPEGLRSTQEVLNKQL